MIIAELVLLGPPQRDHKAPTNMSGLFCFKDVSKARFRKRSRNKKAKATQRVALKSFGLGQCGGEVVRACENDNPNDYKNILASK